MNNQIAVVILERAVDEKVAWLFVGLMNSLDLVRDKAALTQHVEVLGPVSREGNVITIKGGGSRFEGAYDITKLPPDG